MNKIKTSIKLTLLSLLVLCQAGYAQTENVTRQKWLQDMQYEESRVSEYVDLHIKDPLPQAVLDDIKIKEQQEHASGENNPAIIEAISRNYYRQQYFQLHPEAAKRYNPGRVTDHTNSAERKHPKAASASYALSCNGDFEDGNLSSYVGYRSTYITGNCGFVPPSSVAYTPTSLTTSPDDFLLTNNVPDPRVPALRQTNGGSDHAMRINSFNPCPDPGAGINMLQRALPVITVSGKYKLNFSYALVLEDPMHVNGNPFFLARVLNSSGLEVGSRVCRVADISNPFYQTAIIPSGVCHSGNRLVWRDWTCASIEFNAVQGEQYTVEFFAADCSGTGHYGYAYVDDICAELCCPKFILRDCCQFKGGGYDTTGCCNPCKFPDNPFRIFVLDEYGNMAPTADYTISWSHDAGNTTASALLLPNQQTIVTVSTPDGNCMWTDTFMKVCCIDTITIAPDPTVWNPCDPENRFSSLTFRARNRSGTVLTAGAGYTFLWTYPGGSSSGETITLFPYQVPLYVTVTEPVTKCVYRDTFKLDCPCSDTITIARDLTLWEPCAPPNTGRLITLRAKNRIGAILSTGTGYTFSWTYAAGTGTSTGDHITVYPYQLPAYITVKDLATGCIYRDTFTCDPIICDDTVTIVRDSVSWDPCKFIQMNITLRVKNKAGTILTAGAGYTFLWEYAGGVSTSTADFLSLYPFYLPAYVTVTDPVTGCTYRDTFGLHCCTATTPAVTGCRDVAAGREIYWSRVPNAAYYKVKLNINDTRCGCSEINPPGTIVLPVYDTVTTIPHTLASCYSWQVASVCPDSTVSAFSAPMCSCPPVCAAPTDLQCHIIFVPDPVEPVITIQRQLSWSAVPGAVGYEIDIAYNEPGCCLITSMITGIMATVSTNTYVTSAFGCFSWRVRAICSNGMRSPWSTRSCSCNWLSTSLTPAGSTGNTDAELQGMFGPNDRNIQVTAAPNPASDYVDFTIRLRKEEYKDLVLSVVDLNGRELTRKGVVNNTIIRIDVRDYKPGTYLYLVRDNNKVFYSSKVVIQK